MPQQLDADAGAMLRNSMEALGLKVLLKKNTSAILGADRVLGLRFADGSTLECDMVVISAGIQAELGDRGGLRADGGAGNRGRRSDALRDDPHIYAVGECAQHRGQMYGLVAPLWEQAKVLADHITGKNTRAAYHGSKVATKLKVMGVEVASMGIVEPQDARGRGGAVFRAEAGTYKKLIIRDGRLVGGILLGDISKAAYLMQTFDRNTPLPGRAAAAAVRYRRSAEAGDVRRDERRTRRFATATA